jgi:hypothetical protein
VSGLIYVMRQEDARRFSFIGAALALSEHFGAPVVPSQNSLRAVFADGRPPDMVTAYRFVVTNVQAP